MAGPLSISDYYPKWVVHGLWACGHRARIDLGRFIAWGMADVPMMALCKHIGARRAVRAGASDGRFEDGRLRPEVRVTIAVLVRTGEGR
jgi:hypothetical protein